LLPLLALLPAAAPRKTMARACSNLAAPATAVIQPNGEMAGPNLSGLIGRKVGSDPTFDYSPALRKARDEGLGWDASRLDAFLAPIPRKCFRGSGCRCAVSRMPRSGSPSYAFWQNPRRVDG